MLLRSGSGLAVLTLSVVLAGCGVQLPNPAKFQAQSCPKPVNQLPETGDTLFFASTSMIDCRGGRVDFTGYRSNAPSFGLSILPEGISPWRDHFSQRFDEAAWNDLLRERIKEANGHLLIYIHGYNNDFEDALERGLKLSRLNYTGVPVVVVNWPSRNRLLGYTYDESSIGWTELGIEKLLRSLAGMSEHVTLVAHSMGNRAAIGTLLTLDRDPSSGSKHIDKLVLASPDVDRDAALRRDGYLDRLLEAAPNRTIVVYTSYADIPNRTSHRVHGYSRLGSSRCSGDIEYELQQLEREKCHLSFPRERLAVVETGMVYSGGTRHADFVDSCATRHDLSQFLTGASHFPLRRKRERGEKIGWEIDPDLAREQGVRC